MFPGIAISVHLVRTEVRAMHGRVTAGAPTSTEPQKSCMIYAADINPCVARRRVCRLGVALEAQVVVSLDQQLGVDRAVWVMADRAAFAHRFVLEDERLGLFAMTLGAGFIEPRHREAVGGFHEVATVRVMALHAIHFAFDHRMMLRQVELRVRLEMALKTSRRVPARINNEFATSTADSDVFAAGAVAGFATILALPGQAV